MLTIVLQLLLLVSLTVGANDSWWKMIPEELRLVFSLVIFLVNLLVLAFFLYLAGLIVVGKKRALLTDAFTISLLGTILSTLFLMFIPYRLMALILCIVVWLLLVRRLYETSWLGAIAVSILAVMIFLAVTVLLALFFAILFVFEQFLLFTVFMIS